MNKLKKYMVMLSYLEPMEGAILIPAKSKEDAEAKVKLMYINRQGFNLVDVIDTNELSEDTAKEIEMFSNDDNVVPFKK